LAIAILDAANQSNMEQTSIENFIQELTTVQLAEEEQLLKKVESTRVEMETY
jgi:alpha-D-ribose 1-methylphosphonate 5-triphosphate synthase subunit PhnG